MRALLRLLVPLLACHALAASAAVSWTKVYTGLTQPVDIVGARDGTGRLFIVQQTGQVRVVRNGVLLATPFLNIAGSTAASGEQGLLGLAFHPQFATNRQFYVNFTRASDGATVVARYTAPSAGADVADASSGKVLLIVPQPYTNHNGGAMRFGADGFLYIGMGEGCRRSSPSACAIRGASPSIAPTATSGSPTWGRARWRRSTSCPRARARVPTSAGASWKATSARA